jgi:hypothetical protein
VDEGDAARVQLLDQVAEDGLRIAVAGVVRRRDGRQADADAAGADLGHHGIDHLEREAGAVLDRAAVFVGALVGAVAQELVDQVAVGAVDLDAVEAGADRIGGAAAVFVDHLALISSTLSSCGVGASTLPSRV